MRRPQRAGIGVGPAFGMDCLAWRCLLVFSLLCRPASGAGPLQQFLGDGVALYLAGAREHARSEEHTSELQSQSNLVCRLLLEKKKRTISCTTRARQLRRLARFTLPPA